MGPKEHIIDIDRSDNSRKEIRQGLDEIQDQSRFLAIMEMKQVDVTDPAFDIEKRGNYRVVIRNGEELGYIKGRENIKDWMEYRVSYMKSKEQSDYTATTKIELRRNKLIIKTKESLDTLKGGIDAVMSRDINTINRIYEEKNLQLLLKMIEEKIDEHRDEIKSQRQQGNNPEKRLIKSDLRALKILRDDVKSTIKKSTEIEKARDLEDYVPRLVLSLGIQNTTEFSENVKNLLKGAGIKSPNGVFIGEKGGGSEFGTETPSPTPIPRGLGTFESHGLFGGVNELMKSAGFDLKTRCRMATVGNLLRGATKIGTAVYAGWKMLSGIGSLFGGDWKKAASDIGTGAAIGAGAYVFGSHMEGIMRGEMGGPEAGQRWKDILGTVGYWTGGGPLNTSASSVEYKTPDKTTIDSRNLVDKPFIGYLTGLGAAGYVIDQSKAKDIERVYVAARGTAKESEITEELVKQGLIKKSTANNTTLENTTNTTASNAETYRDGIDRGNFGPKLTQIETSIKASNNPENLKRYESVKPDLLRELNTLYTQHPDAHPISIEFDGSTFSITSYGNTTKIDVRNKQSITLVSSLNGSGRSSKMNSIGESVRMANLTNHLMHNFEGKAPESRTSSKYPFYIGPSGSLAFASTGGGLGYVTDTEVLKDEWIGNDFERNFPTLNAEKNANRGYSPFADRLNKMNIWHSGGYAVDNNLPNRTENQEQLTGSSLVQLYESSKNNLSAFRSYLGTYYPAETLKSFKQYLDNEGKKVYNPNLNLPSISVPQPLVDFTTYLKTKGSEAIKHLNEKGKEITGQELINLYEKHKNKPGDMREELSKLFPTETLKAFRDYLNKHGNGEEGNKKDGLNRENNYKMPQSLLDLYEYLKKSGSQTIEYINKQGEKVL